MRFAAAIAASLLAVAPVLRIDAAECPTGFEAMRRLDLLPIFQPNGTQTKQFITYDPAGQNQSALFKRYEQNGEYVFFDEIGPGYLCRQQMNVFSRVTKFPADEVRIRYYFDDEPKPRIDMTFAEFFGKGGKYKKPFSPPLAYFDTLGLQWDQGPGTYAIMYYPFTFKKRLKIAAYHPAGMKQFDATWFQYTYLKYPVGTPVETWKGLEVDSPTVRRQFERLGHDPKPAIDASTHKNAISLAPGETKTALDLPGQGAITSLRLTLAPWSADTLFHTRIRVTWDNQAQPAIDMSLGSFFGAAGDTIGVEDVSHKTLKTLLFGFDGKTGRCYSYWPMPYWSRAHIEFINESRAPITLSLEATHAFPTALPYIAGQAGYFSVKRTVDISPDGELYSRAFEATGRGKVVGLMMYSSNYNMDGDEYTFIDGSRTPQIHGDGTEDDHNQGWGGYAIQKPYWGGLVNGFQGGYRLYLNEPYIFDASIRVCYEHSRCGNSPNRGQKTDFTVWYYQDRPGVRNLRLTDELDVANPASEKMHGYRMTGEKWSGVTSSSYDRMENEPRKPTTTDDGRAFAGASEFTVSIDPANQGVKIRRRVNRNRSNVQRTNVYVDGRLIPDAPWYVCDLPATPETAFRDTDYEIPAAYTHGKQRLTIRLEHVAGQADDSTNAYYYWFYSYGPAKTQAASKPAP
ncbi:MAG: DUF2961 domain-containing protein [Planctomycetaceae bacterium]|nr:DUF2961 domain-containing protein [Planctomycetaceae bacterium]